MTISPLSSLDTIPPNHSEEPCMGKRAKKKKGYFFKGWSVDSNEYCISAIKSASAKMTLSNLKLLDQKTMTQETFVNLLFAWAEMVINDRSPGRGIAFFERELAEPLKVLEPIVRKEKALVDALEKEEQRRAEEEEEGEEGFSTPKPRPKKPPGPKGKNHPKNRNSGPSD